MIACGDAILLSKITGRVKTLYGIFYYRALGRISSLMTA